MIYALTYPEQTGTGKRFNGSLSDEKGLNRSLRDNVVSILSLKLHIAMLVPWSPFFAYISTLQQFIEKLPE